MPDALNGARVEAIGVNAFSFCSSITSVVLPDAVKTIAARAFYSCSSLTNVVLPSGLTSIGDHAFYDNSNLGLNAAPESLRMVGPWAFGNCAKIRDVRFFAKDVEVGESAFSGCSGLTNVVFSSSVGDIGSQAFSSCASLQSVVFTGAVTSVGDRAFWSCRQLSRVTFLNEVGAIGGSAFENCANLSRIVFSSSVGDIGRQAFYSCASLQSVVSTGAVTSVGNEAFRNCRQLSRVAFLDNVGTIGEMAFYGCSSLVDLTFAKALSTVSKYAFAECSALPAVNLPHTVTSLGPGVFSGCSSLTSFVVPTNVTTVSESLLASCTSLTNVVFHPGVTSLDVGCFSQCVALENFVVPSNVVNIAKNALAGTGFWSRQPDDSLVFSCNFFLGVKGTCPSTITWPDNIAYIPDYAFQGETNISYVICSSNLQTIGVGAFADCVALTSVVFPASNSLRQIGAGAFSKTGLVGISIPTNVTSIGASAFADCDSLRELSFVPTNSVVDFASISSNAFSKSELVSLVIPEGVEAIGPFAFSSITSLVSVTFPKTLKTIGEHAFDGCSSLVTCSIPASVSVATNAFIGCTSLGLDPGGRAAYYVVFNPNAEDAVGSVVTQQFAMGVAKALLSNEFTRVGWILDGWALGPKMGRKYALGQQVSNLTKIPGTNVLLYAHWTAEPTTILNEDIGGVIWYYRPSSSGATICRVDEKTTNYIAAVENAKGNVTIPKELGGLKVIGLGENALKGRTGITSVKMECDLEGEYPEGQVELGAYAFRGCSGLRSVELPLGVSTLPEGLFADCTALTDFEMPYSVTEVGASCFSNCTALTAITVTENVTDIDEFAFAGCRNLKIVRYLGDCPEAADNIYAQTSPNLVSGRLSFRSGWAENKTEEPVSDIDDDEDEEGGSIGNKTPTASTNTVVTKQAVWPEGAYARKLLLWNTKMYSFCRVTFNYNNGDAKKNFSRWYVKGRMLGELPETEDSATDSDAADDENEDEGPTLGSLLGWYTRAVGGVELTPTYIVNQPVTCYAHWSIDGGNTSVEALSPFYSEDAGEFGHHAAVYDGLVCADGQVVGTVQVKTAKGKAISPGVTNSSFSASIQILGQKKKTVKGRISEDGEGEGGKEGVYSIALAFTKYGMSGSYEDDEDGASFEIIGARDIYSATIPEAKARVRQALQMAAGSWATVLHTESADGDGAAFASGYSPLTVTVGSKGKVRIAGMLADGTKVSVSSKLIVGDGCCCVPVVLPLYSGKRGGFGGAIWFTWDDAMERAVTVAGLTEWDATMSKTPFSASFSPDPLISLADEGSLPSSATFHLDGDLPEIDGYEMLADDLQIGEVPIVVSGSKWVLPAAGNVRYVKAAEDFIDKKDSENPAGLKLGFTKSTGQFKGSFKVYCSKDETKLKTYTATVFGALVADPEGAVKGYGTATIKKIGSVPVVIE
ncbi:MAG: leucine-rich repeat domain-containing protein [Kiritimatiellae bacterium]|nr:leucine-rich repeat domain-containing protein [Kiritimatiellia bacterium]